MTPTETAPSPRHVFVYGTLRRGEERDISLFRPAPRRVGPAAVSGVLYDLGSYPGLRLGVQSTDPTPIQGEVYEITAPLEYLLDEVEGVVPEPTGEYAKREVLVQLASAAGKPNDELMCLVYEVADARTANCPVISSGDWVSYRQQRGAAV